MSLAGLDERIAVGPPGARESDDGDLRPPEDCDCVFGEFVVCGADCDCGCHGWPDPMDEDGDEE